MGQQQSAPRGAARSGGGKIVTVTAASEAEEIDEDLAALEALQARVPLQRPASLRGGPFSFGAKARAQSGAQMALQPRPVVALCDEYAAYHRDAVLGLCEGQRALAKKMCGVEALCARILYLLALRSNELSGCEAALADLPEVEARLRASRALLQTCVQRAEALNAALPPDAHGAL